MVLISPTLVLMSSSRGALSSGVVPRRACGQILSPAERACKQRPEGPQIPPAVRMRKMSEKSPIIILLAIADPASAARLRGALSGPTFRLVPATEQAEAGEIGPRTLADVIVVVDGEPLALDRRYERRSSGARRRSCASGAQALAAKFSFSGMRLSRRRHQQFLFRRMPRIAS